MDSENEHETESLREVWYHVTLANAGKRDKNAETRLSECPWNWKLFARVISSQRNKNTDTLFQTKTNHV